MNLKVAYAHVYQNGTYYKDAHFFQRALISKEIKIKPKSANIAGVQIADLLANPCKQQLLAERGFIDTPEETFGNQLYDCMKLKFNMHMFTHRIEGYGKVFIG